MMMGQLTTAIGLLTWSVCSTDHTTPSNGAVVDSDVHIECGSNGGLEGYLENILTY
jgi:hypothetical protein